MIHVTDAAAQKAAEIAAREGSPPILRLSVQGGGCVGMSYVYAFDPAGARPNDHSWQVGALQVVCDPKSMQFLDGTELDYDTHMLRGGFRFTNPQAKRTCSCGESFDVG